MLEGSAYGVRNPYLKPCTCVLNPWHADRFGLMTAARTARVGLYSSLAFGLGQDALRLARGHRLGYVDSLLGRSRRLYEVDEKVI